MNHIELPNLIQSYDTIFTFLVNHGLLAARHKCQCSQNMVIREKANSEDGYYWECPVRHCRKRWSIRTGSIFEDSKVSLAKWLYIIFLWSIEESNKKVSLLSGVSLRTVVTILQRLRDICSLKIMHSNIKLGGRGKTVEIDESMFGHKRKYNCGRISYQLSRNKFIKNTRARTKSLLRIQKQAQSQLSRRIHEQAQNRVSP